MKSKQFIAALLLLSALAWAQETLPEWQITTYDSLGEETLAEINQRIQQGYLPVGMDLSESEGLTMLYSLEPETAVYDWMLKEFADVSALNEEFTGTITAGWLPMDIAVSDGAVFGFFVQTDATIAGWRITTSNMATVDATAAQQQLRTAGFSPWGVAFNHSGQLWHLALNFVDEDALQSTLVGFPAGTADEPLGASIAQITTEGWRPWGLTRTPDEVIMHFVLLQ